MNTSTLHAVSATLALLLIATFWTSTLVAELLLGADAIVAVKHAIARYGLIALLLTMAATGASGFALSRGRSGRLLDAKKRRMPLLGLNGLLLMIPAALWLDHKAGLGEFDTAFYAIQTVELLVGLLQLTLIGLNVRAGLQLSGRRRPRMPAQEG